MDFLLTAGGLFVSAFTSATILPGTSDAAFAAAVHYYPQQAWLWLLAAGCGNTLGGVLSYWLGRLLPERYQQRITPPTLARLRRFGVWTLLFAWLPVAGDLLPLAAGGLRLNALYCTVALAAGKFARYGILMLLFAH